MADAGDSYDFSPLPGDKPRFLNKAELVGVEKGSLSQQISIRHEKQIPRELQDRQSQNNMESLTILTTLELRKGEAFVRVTHNIENKSKDHRVRVLLNTGTTATETSFADQGFSIVERPLENPYYLDWRENQFAEAPVSIYPLENFAGAISNAGTLAAITKGIKEYEVLSSSGELALTLFRSVGLLGRDDLEWRPGRASGINNKVVYTPDAQMQQSMTFEYAITFSSQRLKPERLFTLTEEYQGHYATYQKQTLNTFEERLERFEIPYPISSVPESDSLFSLDSSHVFVSALKRGHDDNSVIVRLFNPADEEKVINLNHRFESAVITNLAEQRIADGSGTALVPAKGYITLKLL